MQRDRAANSIPGLSNCLIDGFKHSLDHISDLNRRIYFLTHFHIDHYTGLNQGWNAGHIFCSSTTAKLLINVMKIRRTDLIHSVEIGETITIPGTKVTFLDANHCPGAVILFFQLDTGVMHLHTGDMRYHPRMKEIPALKGAKIDKLFLDTTCAHPKHQFRPQSDVINDIIRHVKEFLLKYGESGLICLSAYSLGKERVIFDVQDAIGKPIYMDDKKINIMNQIEGGSERIVSGMFTNDPLKANIHICGKGMAGLVGLYFRANFDGLEANRQSLNELKANAQSNPATSGIQLSPLTHVLAIIPTGWAESSSYNRSHCYQVQNHLTVQLVAYSKHSQYQELVDFVGFLKPREVVPTVFADDRNRVFITHLFRNLVVNKQNFFHDFGNNVTQSQSDSCVIDKNDRKVRPISEIDISNFGKIDQISTFKDRQTMDVAELDKDETEGIVLKNGSITIDTTIPIDQCEVLPPTSRSRSTFQTAVQGSVVSSGYSAPAGGMMNLWLRIQEPRSFSPHSEHVKMSSQSGNKKSMNTDLNVERIPPLAIPSFLSTTSLLSERYVGTTAKFASCSSISLPPPIVTVGLSSPSSSNPISPSQQQHSPKSTMIAAWMASAATSPNTPNATATLLYSTSQKNTPRKRAASEVVSDRISQDLCMTFSSSSVSPIHNQNHQRSIAHFFYTSSPASSKARVQQHAEGNSLFNQSCQSFDLNMNIDPQMRTNAIRRNSSSATSDPIVGSIQSYNVDEQELGEVAPSVAPSQLDINCEKENFGGAKVAVSSALPKSQNSTAIELSHGNERCLLSNGPCVAIPSQKKIKLSSNGNDPRVVPQVVENAMEIDFESIVPCDVNHSVTRNHKYFNHIPNHIPHYLSNSSQLPKSSHSQASSFIVPPTPRGRRAPPMSSWTTSEALATPKPPSLTETTLFQSQITHLPPHRRNNRTNAFDEKEKRRSPTVSPENHILGSWACHMCTFLNQSSVPSISSVNSGSVICAMCNKSCNIFKRNCSISLSLIDPLES